MEDRLTARPMLLKQANLSLVRKTIRDKNTATRAEIAQETRISSTTVRALLSEMMQNGEIESIGFDESSGGRKAERYRFRPDRYYGAALCMEGTKIYGLLVNTCGEITDTTELDIADRDIQEVITSFLDGLVKEKEIRAIGIGVPGIVEGGSYWKKSIHGDEWFKSDLGDILSERYQDRKSVV